MALSGSVESSKTGSGDGYTTANWLKIIKHLQWVYDMLCKLESCVLFQLC